MQCGRFNLIDSPELRSLWIHCSDSEQLHQSDIAPGGQIALFTKVVRGLLKRRVSQAIWWLFLDRKRQSPITDTPASTPVQTNCISRRHIHIPLSGITLYHSGECFCRGSG